MSTQTQISNLAIANLGSGKNIASVTERSEEAAACSRWFAITRQRLLQDFPWAFATKFASLALVSQNPTTEYAYAYRAPADCLGVRRILSGTNPDTSETVVGYIQVADIAGVLLYSNQPLAVCEYTSDVTEPAYWPPDFVVAFSYALAASIAPNVTAGDPYHMGEKCDAKYRQLILGAQENSINGNSLTIQPESELTQSRN